jgi:hypothetical protein
MARSAVLVGRTLADLSRSVFSVSLMVGLGLLVGFHFRTSFGDALAGLALVIVFGYCFSWVYATIGLLTKDPETAQVAGILPFFVLVFASSAIVPVANAELASAFRQSPACQHHDRCCAGAPPRPAHAQLGVAVTSVVGRDLRGVLRDRRTRIPQCHFVDRGASPRASDRRRCESPPVRVGNEVCGKARCR